MRNPHKVQEHTFNYLLSSAKNTEYGKLHGFSDIRTPEEFKRRLPINTYEDIYPYIERSLRGEQNLLWGTDIKWFSKSSGTTNARSKFIPISTESLEDCHYKAGKDMLTLYFNNYPESRLFTGKTLGIGGSLYRNELNPKTFIGDVSALIMKNLPLWAEYIRTPSIDVALMDNWEEKIVKMAQVVAKENVTAMTGVPTWTLMVLQRVLELTGKSHIREIWPDLEIYAHGAVAFGPYRDSFNEIIGGGKMNYVETYNASEGFFGVQDTADTHDIMLLMLDYGLYYEFAPMDELDKDHPKTVGLDEVEIGKNYALIVSSNGGLWRYLIGDTIKFVSTDPYRIKVSGRTKHFINAFGEEVIIENADFAISEACHQTGALVSDFTAAPVYLEVGNKGGHEWIIEFDQEPSDIEIFTRVLDDKLKEVNSDYEAKRQADIALVRPKIHVASKGTFYKWLKEKGKLGGQNKVPRLSNNREYLESILQMM